MSRESEKMKLLNRIDKLKERPTSPGKDNSKIINKLKRKLKQFN